MNECFHFSYAHDIINTMGFDTIEQIRRQYRESLFGENAHFAGADIDYKKIPPPPLDPDTRAQRPPEESPPEVAVSQEPVATAFAGPTASESAPVTPSILSFACFEDALPSVPIADQTQAAAFGTAAEAVATPGTLEKTASAPIPARSKYGVIFMILFIVLLAVATSVLSTRGILHLDSYREWLHAIFGNVFGG
jgi:hypothetical protein